MIRRGLAGAVALLCAGGRVGAADDDVVLRIGGVELLGQTPSYVHVGVGGFDILDRVRSARPSAAGELEVRLGEKFRGIGPAIGVVANSRGGVFGYASAYADLRYRGFILTPFAGMGGYSRGNSSNLGGRFQFRLGAGAAWPLQNGDLVGIRVAHISNAGIHAYNPGAEELYLTYAIALP